MIITEKMIKDWIGSEAFDYATSVIDECDVKYDSFKDVNEWYSDKRGILISAHVRLPDVMNHMFCEVKIMPQGLVETYCGSYEHSSFRNVSICSHVAVLLVSLIPYFKEHPLKQTHRVIDEVIRGYSTINFGNNEQISFEPVVSYEEGKLMLNAKIGNTKKYQIKNFSTLIDAFFNKETINYGKNLEIVHDEKNISEDSITLYKLIKDNVLLYNQNQNIIGGKRLDKNILLTSGNMDVFFDLYQDKQVTNRKRKGEDFLFLVENPKLDFYLSKRDDSQVVTLSYDSFATIDGLEHSYILVDNKVYRIDEKYNENVYPFLTHLNNTSGKIQIDLDDMSIFSDKVLRRLKQYLNIIVDGFEIDNYTPPKSTLKFYLDYDGFVTLNPIIEYDDIPYNLYDNKRGNYKDISLEENAKMLIERSFINDEKDGLFLPNNDEDIYSFLTDRIQQFEQIGEVFIADGLKRININYNQNVSIGVRLESDLLNIDIDVENIKISDLQDILKSYKLKKKYHRLKNGQFIDLNNDGLETLNQIVEGTQLSLKELAKGSATIPAYRALYLDKLLSESDTVIYSRDHHIKELLKDFKAIEDSSFEVPAKYEKILRPYQILGYQWLKTLDYYHFGGVLADDMGLGKTLQMIVFLYDYYQNNKTPSLIITPASLVYNWEDELQRFAPELKVGIVAGSSNERAMMLENYKDYHIIVTSYDLLKRDIGYYEDKDFAYQVIDEGQYIKNSMTLQSKSVKAIKAKQRFALTGTPIENRLSELWSLFDFIMPGFLYQYKTFKEDFEKNIVKEKDEDATMKLQKMIAPFILRRLKKDVLKDLPDKIEKVNITSLEGEQKTLYDTYAAKVKLQLGSQKEEDFNKSKIQVLAELTKLRQICCDPSLIYKDYEGGSMKLKQCIDLIEQSIEANHKIIVFSQFTSMLDIIQEELYERYIGTYVIKGSTSKAKRMEYVKQFNEDDTPVFLISLKAGGTGLNLTSADIVIHYDPWWNVAAQNQATDRAHRIGQKNVVTVYQMITKDTIEEKILKLQETKQELVDQVLTGENTSLTTLSKEDLLEILT